MLSRREHEEKSALFFTQNLFWIMEDWQRSLPGLSTDGLHDRKWLEIFLRLNGFFPISKLGPIVDNAYHRLCSNELNHDSSHELVLDNITEQLQSLYKTHEPLFKLMGTNVEFTKTISMEIRVEKRTAYSPFPFLMWWLMDAWPESNICVELISEENLGRVVFHCNRHPQVFRDEHKNLPFWEHIVDYLIKVEYHGLCLWPKIITQKKLEIILPLYPPTPIELNEPLPGWLQI